MYIVLQDCILHQFAMKKWSLNSEKHCSLIALLQQSAGIVLIEEERTLFNTTNPYQDINNQSCELGHSGQMENSKVMIFFYYYNYYKLILLSKHDKTHSLLINSAVLVFLAASEWSASPASSLSSMSGYLNRITGLVTG